MKTWDCEINDVLIIEQVARLARFEDSLDDTKPVYVNLRVSDGQRWGERQVKIQPSQIKGVDKDWYKRREEQWQAELKTFADAQWAKETPEQRQRITNEVRRFRSRSPLDVLIDRACGIE